MGCKISISCGKNPETKQTLIGAPVFANGRKSSTDALVAHGEAHDLTHTRSK